MQSLCQSYETKNVRLFDSHAVRNMKRYFKKRIVMPGSRVGPDTDLAGYPANDFAGYRISG